MIIASLHDHIPVKVVAMNIPLRSKEDNTVQRIMHTKNQQSKKSGLQCLLS